MGFIEGKCPACAKEIQVPAEEEKFFCPYCGSQFLRDAACAFAARPNIVTGESDLSDFVIVGGTLVNYAGTSANVVIPDTVTCIGNEAFYGNKYLVTITMPNSLTSIGNRAFKDCSSLATVNCSESLVSLGDGVFQRCISLTEIKLPPTTKKLGNTCFNGCLSMTAIYIPTHCTYGSCCFDGNPAKIIKV